MEREFLGVWIPKEIYLHKGLTPTEKLLMAEIMSFSKNGVCFASNEHFAEFLGISKSHVSRLVSKLVKLGLVTVDFTYKENSKEIDKRIISPTLKQENTPVPVVTQEQAPILIEADTPIRTDAYTPTHESVDPLRTEAHTSTHGCVDPLRTDAYDKEQYKIQDKIQSKDINKNIMLISDETSKKATQLESEFERLWKLYPRKEGRKKAFESFKKARKDKKVPYEIIENGLYRYLRYIEQQDTDSQFIPHGSTWFNQHRWQDEYAVQARKPKNALEYYRMKHGGMNHEPNGNGEIFDHYSTGISELFQGF